MTLSERLKSFKTHSYREMSEQCGLSEYKISRIMNTKPTSDEIRSLIKICEDCFDIHISEVLEDTMDQEHSSHVWTKTETVNGVKEKHEFRREKDV